MHQVVGIDFRYPRVVDAKACQEKARLLSCDASFEGGLIQPIPFVVMLDKCFGQPLTVGQQALAGLFVILRLQTPCVERNFIEIILFKWQVPSGLSVEIPCPMSHPLPTLLPLATM